LGANSIANRPNTVSVGSPGAERIIANVAPGVLGTDAVNVNQLNAVQGQIFGLQQQINQNQKEARQGIAMAMAANGITTPIRPGGTTVGVSGGFFESQGAVGVSVAHRLYALPGAVVFGSYANSGSQSGGRVGASYEF
jgi:autotransporter adhesin